MSDDDLRKYLPSAETLARALDEEAAQAAAQKTAENPALKKSLAELLAMRKPGEQPFDWLDDPQWLPDAEPSERVEHVPPTELPRARVPHVTLTKIRVAPEVIAATPAGRATGAAGEGKAPMLDPRRIPTLPRLGTPGVVLPLAEQVLMPSTWDTNTKDPAAAVAADVAAQEPAPVVERALAQDLAPAIVPVGVPQVAVAPPRVKRTGAVESARPAMSRGRLGIIGLAAAMALTALVVLAKQAETVSPPDPAAVVTAAVPAQEDPQLGVASPGAMGTPGPPATSNVIATAASGSPPPPPVKSATAAAIPKPPEQLADAGVADSQAAPTSATTSSPEPSPPASSEPVAPEATTAAPLPPPAPPPTPSPSASTPPPARTSKLPPRVF